MSDYDLSIHTNPDAVAWAKFFMKTMEEKELASLAKLVEILS